MLTPVSVCSRRKVVSIINVKNMCSCRCMNNNCSYVRTQRPKLNIKLKLQESLFSYPLSITVIPQLGSCLGAESLWQQCAGQGSVYSVSAESFLDTLSTAYTRLLPEKASGMADTGTSASMRVCVSVCMSLKQVPC